MLKKRLLQLKLLFLADVRKPVLLAKSVALGAYVAFCPFIGLHMLLIFFVGWLFSLSIPIMFMVCLLLHNPWTMLFIYGAGYFCGSLVYHFFQIEHTFLDQPVAMVLQYIPYVSVSPQACIKFFVGGNVLGVVTAFFLYPFVKRYAMRYNKQNKSPRIVP
jgi:uncharacterized protein (DUF2062 family)